MGLSVKVKNTAVDEWGHLIRDTELKKMTKLLWLKHGYAFIR